MNNIYKELSILLTIVLIGKLFLSASHMLTHRY